MLVSLVRPAEQEVEKKRKKTTARGGWVERGRGSGEDETRKGEKRGRVQGRWEGEVVAVGKTSEIEKNQLRIVQASKKKKVNCNFTTKHGQKNNQKKTATEKIWTELGQMQDGNRTEEPA